LPRVKINDKKSLKEMAGIIKIGYKTDSVDLVDSIHDI
jgi:hypothetical protein